MFRVHLCSQNHMLFFNFAQKFWCRVFKLIFFNEAIFSSGQDAVLRGGACVAPWPPSICHEPECDNSIIIPIHHSVLANQGAALSLLRTSWKSIKEGGFTLVGTLLSFGFTTRPKFFKFFLCGISSSSSSWLLRRFWSRNPPSVINAPAKP